MKMKDEMKKLTDLVGAIVSQYERQGGHYSADSIAGKSDSQTGEPSLVPFMQGVIGQLRQLGKVRTSETYTAALASFMKFREGQDVLFCEMDSNAMMPYEAWLRGKGICPNTVSFYMRILRAVYNRAVEKGLTEQKHPFKHVYTGVGKTVKRAIPLKEIRRIKGLDLQASPAARTFPGTARTTVEGTLTTGPYGMATLKLTFWRREHGRPPLSEGSGRYGLQSANRRL